MTCSDYFENFSDFLDGTAPEGEIAGFEAHLESCAACRRYRDVLLRGSELLKALPEPELSHDFVPRLRHRLYHVEDSPALTTGASGTPAMTVLGMALLFTAIAWSPALMPRPAEVELAPIVVNRPPRTTVTRPIQAMPGELSRRAPLSDLERGLWDDAQSLMYEYSPLSQRYRQRASVRRTGLERDR